MRTSRELASTLAAFVALSLAAACGGPPVVTTNTPATPRPVVSAPVDLTVPPTLAPPPALRLPPVTTRTLPNGLTLVVVEQHELPLADVILDVRTGGEADPAGKAGAASLTAGMLTEGTTTRSSLQI